MSEAAESESEEGESRGREVWIEKYRPQTLDDVVGHENITERLEHYIEKDDLPHLLFAGPAGTGKCVTGETPVLTDAGVQRIEDVVGTTEGFAEPRPGLRVLTYEQGSFEYTQPSHVYGKEASDLLEVDTRDGNTLTVTPEHKLLVATHDGLQWTEASDLNPGDRLARPLHAPLPDGDGTIDWISRMDGDRTLVTVTEAFAREHEIPVEEDYVGKMKAVVAGLRRDESESQIAAEADVPPKTVQAYRRRVADRDLGEPSTTCSLGYLRDLDVPREVLREHVVGLQWVTPQNTRSRQIRPPWEVTPELATFVALALSEARIDRGRVKFYNTDERLLDRFERGAERQFGLDTISGEQHDVPYREVVSRSLTHFLESCFDCFGDLGDASVGSTILRADEESRAAFLRAFFDAEAYVTEGGIVELSQKDGDLVTLLSYLLAGIGVPTRRKVERKAPTNGSGTERTYHTLYLSGAAHLQRFQGRVGFTDDEKARRLAENAARSTNANHDTVPTQAAVDHLCEALYLQKEGLVPDSLDPETPGRENYMDALELVLSEANERLEAAQETLERLDRVSAELDRVDSLPAVWAGERDRLAPLATRKRLANETGVRTDRLLEYSDGRRNPYGGRATELLAEAGVFESAPDTPAVRSELRAAIERLGVPYEHVARETDLRGTDVINLLTNEGTSIGSLTRFATVADRLRTVAGGMLSESVLESLRTLDAFGRGELYFDAVEAVEPTEEPQRVYDLSVPGTRNYVAGDVPTVMHNTTSAVAIAKHIYGDEWRENFLELNASDQRGIDVVRDRIKNFARSSFGGYDYRIIFLDEADALTSDAQSALRRTMEQFSNNTRFILSCNYSSRIIDPIQSRCAVFRFSPLGDDAIAKQVRIIADAEGIEVTDDGVDALVYAAGGDMRKAINGLQAAAVLDQTVDEEAVFAITSTARPEEIEEMVQMALDGEFTASRARLESLLVDSGIAGGDIISQLHRSVWEFDLTERQAVRLMERVGEADYRITAGANEQVQLEALLASLALEDRAGEE
jgi:DNA polymerase III delta prime subunit